MTPHIMEALPLSRRVTVGSLHIKVTLNTKYSLICVPF